MKLLNKSISRAMIFIAMSVPWQVLQTFRFLRILQTSFSFVFLQLKIEFNYPRLILATFK